MMMPIQRAWNLRSIVMAWIAAQAASVVGQTPPNVPSFPTAAEIVTVDVVVLDKSGGVVRGLTKDDFVVMEGKRRQTISAFEAWEMPGDATAADPVAATRPSERESGERRRRAFAIIVDDITLDQVPITINLQKALTSWMAEQLDARDELTLVTTSGSVFLSGRVGQDQERFLAAIESIRGLRPPPGVGSSPLPWATDVEHRQAVYRVVDQISFGLSGWRGRKTIVLLSQELKFKPEDDQTPLQKAIDASRRANTAVYSIDARFLTGPSAFSGHMPAEPPGGFGGQSSGLSLVETQAIAGARHLAEETGGFATIPSNNLRLGLDRVEAEARANYILGYEPDRALDGKWRKISVKVLRPDLTVRARRGYFATRRKDSAALARELTLTAMMEEGAPRRDFECHVTVSEFEAQGAERHGTFLLDVPAQALEGHSFPQLTFLALIKDTRGRLVVRLSHEPTPDKPLVRSDRGDVHFRKTVRLTPGDYTLEVVILEATSGRRCRDSATFKVP